MTQMVSIEVRDRASESLARLGAMAPTAIMRAINRTAQWSRTRAIEAITANMALKKSDLDGRHRFGGVFATKARPQDLQAVLRVTGKRIPLFRFAGRPTQPGRTSRGISYQIDAGGSRKRIEKNAFFARLKSGHEGFFRRLADRKGLRHTRGPKLGKRIGSGELAELRGPSIPHVAENQPAFQKMLRVDAGQRLELQLEREANFILTGTSKGASDGAD